MTDEEKTTSEDRRETFFGFPFGNAERMKEMMRMCCPDQTKISDCCSMMQRMMDKQARKTNGEQTG